MPVYKLIMQNSGCQFRSWLHICISFWAGWSTAIACRKVWYTYSYLSIYIRMHVCKYVCVHTHMRTCRAHTCPLVTCHHTHVHSLTHPPPHTHPHTRPHTHTHTHTHTGTCWHTWMTGRRRLCWRTKTVQSPPLPQTLISTAYPPSLTPPFCVHVQGNSPYYSPSLTRPLYVWIYTHTYTHTHRWGDAVSSTFARPLQGCRVRWQGNISIYILSPCLPPPPPRSPPPLSLFSPILALLSRLDRSWGKARVNSLPICVSHYYTSRGWIGWQELRPSTRALYSRRCIVCVCVCVWRCVLIPRLDTLPICVVTLLCICPRTTTYVSWFLYSLTINYAKIKYGSGLSQMRYTAWQQTNSKEAADELRGRTRLT